MSFKYVNNNCIILYAPYEELDVRQETIYPHDLSHVLMSVVSENFQFVQLLEGFDL